MSPSSRSKVLLGLDELVLVVQQLRPVLACPPTESTPGIETYAAVAILQSFYGEIEKVLKLLAVESGRGLPQGDSWHQELLNGLAAPASAGPAVLEAVTAARLKPYLSFRHLSRGASIVLMRWEKLAPLAFSAEEVRAMFDRDIRSYLK